MKVSIEDVARVCHEAERATHLSGGIEDVPFCSISPEARDAYILKIEECVENPQKIETEMKLPEMLFIAITNTMLPFLPKQSELTGEVGEDGRHKATTKVKAKTFGAAVK